MVQDDLVWQIFVTAGVESGNFPLMSLFAGSSMMMARCCCWINKPLRRCEKMTEERSLSDLHRSICMLCNVLRKSTLVRYKLYGTKVNFCKTLIKQQASCIEVFAASTALLKRTLPASKYLGATAHLADKLKLQLESIPLPNCSTSANACSHSKSPLDSFLSCTGRGT